LVFEEYRSEFLGHEILNMFRVFEKLNANENFEDISSYINKYFSENQSSKIAKEQKLELHKEGSAVIMSTSMKEPSSRNFLFKNLTRFYDDLKLFRFFKIPINNWYEFKAPTKLLSFCSEIQNYHTIILNKGKKITEWLQQSDINPLTNIFLSVVTPFKNFLEISLDNKIPMDFIKLIAKQIHCLGLGKITKKLHNNSILTVNPDAKITVTLELEFNKQFNRNIYDEALNHFTFNKGLNKIFKKHFYQFTNDKFLQIIEFLLSNECLASCCTYFLPKMKLKRSFCAERILLNKSLQLFTKSEKLEPILNDLDANSEDSYGYYVQSYFTNRRSGKMGSSKKLPKSDPTLEDFILCLRYSNPADFEVFNNIYYFFNENFDIDMISYYTGYKDEKLLKFLKKYKFLFNVIISIEE
jgi:hypothetical protein